MAHTRTEALVNMMRSNRKGNRGPRMARTTENPKNRDHGRLLQQSEKVQNRRQSGDELI